MIHAHGIYYTKLRFHHSYRKRVLCGRRGDLIYPRSYILVKWILLHGYV